jgi:PAS domain S-box-containing protein
MSLKYRIAITILVLEAIMVGLVLWYVLSFTLERNHEQFRLTHKVTIDYLHDISITALLTENFGELQAYIERLRDDPQILTVLVADRANRVVASNQLRWLGQPLGALHDAHERYWITRDVRGVAGALGRVAVEFSTAPLLNTVKAARRFGMTIALSGMGIIAGVGLLLGFALTRRLSRLNVMAHRLAAGEHDVQIDLHGRDEVAQLGRSFNHMARTIHCTVEALQAREEQFRGLLAGSIQGVLIHRNFQALFVNPAFASMLGYDSPEDIQKMATIFPLYAPHEHARLQQYYWARMQDLGAPDHYELQAVHRDGTILWLEHIAQRVMWEGEPAVQSAVIDISGRKLAEAERLRMAECLRQGQKMEAIGTVAGGIAHEFNNILAGMIGCAELLRLDTQPGTNVDHYTQQMLRAGQRAKELVQQILTFSHQGAPMSRQSVPLTRMVNDVLQLLRASLPSTITIHSQLTEMPTTVLANPTQLQQILLNLCTNAEHAMRACGGQLDISVDTCILSPLEVLSRLPVDPGLYVRLRFSDTGCGMSEEVMARIFEPFFTTKPAGEGTGLGLSIVHGIIESYDGVITVESTPGLGTTFVIYLPFYETPASGLEAIEHVLPTGHGCILVVDDEADIVQVTQRLLERLGYDVVGATSSLEALELFRADPVRFHVVLTDQTMPHLTGERLAQILRGIRADIPIILCTGFSQMMSAEKARDLGIDAFCLKPIGAYHLANTLHQVLTQSRQQNVCHRNP